MQRYCKRAERKLVFSFPSAAISYAKVLQTSGKKTCFQFPECSYILCKGIANERKENLFSVSRVQLYLMQR